MANKADVNAKASDGLTPLHLAASNDKKDVVELLLAKGADNKGETPLHLAVDNGKQDVAELLRQHGGHE